MTELKKEQLYPAAFGIASAVVCCVLSFLADCIPSMNDKLATVSITVAAIFAGFDSVNRNTLLNLKNTATVRLMRSMYRNIILEYITEMMRSAVSVVVFCLFYLAVEKMSFATNSFVFSLWCGLMTWMILSFVRIHFIMARLYDESFPHS